jgi:hypothetical protein
MELVMIASKRKPSSPTVLDLTKEIIKSESRNSKCTQYEVLDSRLKVEKEVPVSIRTW